jgi:hypothetical protein
MNTLLSFLQKLTFINRDALCHSSGAHQRAYYLPRGSEEMENGVEGIRNYLVHLTL